MGARPPDRATLWGRQQSRGRSPVSTIILSAPTVLVLAPLPSPPSSARRQKESPGRAGAPSLVDAQRRTGRTVR